MFNHVFEKRNKSKESQEYIQMCFYILAEAGTPT